MFSFFSSQRRAIRMARARFRPLFETLEARLNLAYLGFTTLTGADNPFDGFNVGARSAPALGDLDHDGDLDALVGKGDGTLTFFENIGTAISPVYADGLYLGLVFHVGSNSVPTLGDVDHDGDLDLLVGAGNETLTYFKNTGTATSPFYEDQGVDSPFFGLNDNADATPTLGDVDGDGDLDLLVGAANGYLYYSKNTGTATSPFYLDQGSASPFYGFNVGSRSTPTLGDLDRDGDLDLIVGAGNGTLTYFKNTGTAASPLYVDQGAANPFQPFNVSANSATTLGDIDHDGDLDVLMGASSGALFFLRNDAVPPTVHYTSLSGPANPFDSARPGVAPALGDVDSDGDLDYLVGEAPGEAPRLYLVENVERSTPTYIVREELISPSGFSPALGDLDNDGDLDALVGRLNGGEVLYLMNRGDATYPQYSFGDGLPGLFEGVASMPALGDVDGDGDLDTIFGNLDGRLNYWNNIGTATTPEYRAQGTVGIFLSLENSAPALGDLDGDGDLDLLVGNIFGTLDYFENTGTATNPDYDSAFNAASPFDGFHFATRSGPSFGDVDRDGDLDIVVGSERRQLFYLRANRAPVVDVAIPDQTFSGPGSFSYTVPANTFLDLDRDELSIDARLAGPSGGETLPAWLTFNRSTRTFSGNPETLDASSLQIRVSANDADGSYAYEEFQLTLDDVGDYTNLDPTTGELVVRGGAGGSNDVLTLIPTQFGTYIMVNNQVSLFGPSSFTSISINLGGGANVINLEGTPTNIPVNVHGSGTDTVNIGSSFAGVQNVRGTVNIENEGSGTTINIDDRANTRVSTAHMGTIPFGAPGWGYVTLLAPADIHYKYADTTSVTIHTSTADGDSFGVWENGVPTTLVTHGQAAVSVGNGNVGVDALLGHLTVKGNGNSALTINDQQGTGLPAELPAESEVLQHSLTYAVTAQTVSRAASYAYVTPAGGGGGSSYLEISYQGIAGLELNTSNDDAVIDVQSTAAATPVTINTTDGVNTVSVHHTDDNGIKNLFGDVQVNGGGGPTTVAILDLANPQTQVIVGPSGITIGDPVTIGYSNVQLVTLYAAISVDYEIVGVPPSPIVPSQPITIYFGAGPNTFHVAPGALPSLTLKGSGSAPITFDHTGDATGATYIITSSTVQVNDSAPISYSGASSLTVKGGSGNDSFQLPNVLAAVPLTLDGGGGTNTLDYSSSTAGATVNLLSGAATGLAFISRIQNVLGGAGDDILIGNDLDNVLTGNGGNDLLLGLGGIDELYGAAGRDILIGGLGADVLEGGTGDDVLLGGYTSYDTQMASNGAIRNAIDLPALEAILQEWAQGDSPTLSAQENYKNRISHLRGGGGLNGSSRLDKKTAFDDADLNTLIGGDGFDWFLLNKKQDSDDRVAPETETSL